MDDQIEAMRRLQRCHSLYLDGFGRGEEDMDLVVKVLEARPEPDPSTRGTGSALVDKVLGPVHAIVTGPDCARFTLTFEGYVAFVVRDESYASPEKNEDYSKRLRTYESSAFLDYVKESTIAHLVRPAPVRHFAVVCLNHVIDVACSGSPIITVDE